jgi:hypothetical protein
VMSFYKVSYFLTFPLKMEIISDYKQLEVSVRRASLFLFSDSMLKLTFTLNFRSDWKTGLEKYYLTRWRIYLPKFFELSLRDLLLLLLSSLLVFL